MDMPETGSRDITPPASESTLAHCRARLNEALRERGTIKMALYYLQIDSNIRERILADATALRRGDFDAVDYKFYYPCYEED